MEHIGVNARQRYNVNVPVETSNNENVNVQRIAHRLADKLNDNHSMQFFKKVASTLPENEIENILENATMSGNIRNPAAYFSKVCKIKMGAI